MIVCFAKMAVTSNQITHSTCMLAKMDLTSSQITHKIEHNYTLAKMDLTSNQIIIWILLRLSQILTRVTRSYINNKLLRTDCVKSLRGVPKASVSPGVLDIAECTLQTSSSSS